jgi:hypothetical protein
MNKSVKTILGRLFGVRPMYELRIFDSEKEMRSIISLGVLIEQLEGVFPDLFLEDWVIKKGAWAGYGETVCSLEDELGKCKEMRILGDTIFLALKSGKEYFYHVCFENRKRNMQIGVFDSAYNFVISNDAKLLKRLRTAYKETELVII